MRRAGPTGLNDEVVTDILSTMIPYKLEMVKVQKQHELQRDESEGLPFQEYDFHWREFLRDFKLQHVRKSKSKSCSVCEAPLICPSGAHITLLMTKPSNSTAVAPGTPLQIALTMWNAIGAWNRCVLVAKCCGVTIASSTVAPNAMALYNAYSAMTYPANVESSLKHACGAMKHIAKNVERFIIVSDAKNAFARGVA